MLKPKMLTLHLYRDRGISWGIRSRVRYLDNSAPQGCFLIIFLRLSSGVPADVANYVALMSDLRTAFSSSTAGYGKFFQGLK